MIILTTTDRAEADACLARISATRPLAEIRQPIDGTWEVHDLPAGYFSEAMLEDMVQRVLERVRAELNLTSGG